MICTCVSQPRVLCFSLFITCIRSQLVLLTYMAEPLHLPLPLITSWAPTTYNLEILFIFSHGFYLFVCLGSPLRGKKKKTLPVFFSISSRDQCISVCWLILWPIQPGIREPRHFFPWHPRMTFQQVRKKLDWSGKLSLAHVHNESQSKIRSWA